jgi:predicted 3-demethylubiquinone-9 3-methyltransferase (glyoxalase superfamily)
MRNVAPCLWFDDNAEEAVNYYVSIFSNSKVDKVVRWGEGWGEHGAGKQGKVLAIDFTIEGRPFKALNGGPHFKFNEAISLVVRCRDQEEVDYYWDRLSAGGDPRAQQCGWLKDRFGLSWQVVPDLLNELIASPEPEKARKVMAAMLQMKKFDVEALRRAAD